MLRLESLQISQVAVKLLIEEHRLLLCRVCEWQHLEVYVEIFRCVVTFYHSSKSISSSFRVLKS